MRTTINLEADVARAVDRYRREHGAGLSEALNELVRDGLRATHVDYVYAHPTRDMGALVDLANVADVLELLDETDHSTGERARGAARAS